MKVFFLIVTLAFISSTGPFLPMLFAQDDAPPPDTPPRLSPPMEAFWAQRRTGYLSTRDGVQLRYSVLLPTKMGRFPVIINYSGYDPGAIGGLAYREGDTAMSYSLDRTLLENGYAVMGVNARGSGCSSGVFDFLGPKYGEDGFDIVEFASMQEWSNGAVGMANWSWAGMSQLMTAAERPPHLKAIAPGMVVGDMRRDSWAPGGVPAPYFVANWRGYLHSRWGSVQRSAEDEKDMQCVKQVQRNLADEDEHSVSRLVFGHPQRDEVSDSRAPAKRVQLINVPVFSMESFQDEAVTSREDYYQERLDPQRIWMLQTNGGHDLYDSQAVEPFLLGFFDHFVKGIDNGFPATHHVTVWMQTHSAGTDYASRQELAAPGWSFTLPSVAAAPVRPVEFYLAGQSRLTMQTSVDSGADTYRYPVPGPAVSPYDDPEAWGAQPASWQQGSVVYTGEPLDRSLLAYGSASADLWLSSTEADADIQVTLTEVRPDGQEMYVQRGWLRLSNRALDPALSMPLRPVPIDRPEAILPLNPNEPVLGRVEINKFAHAFRAGSRLRIWIDTPSFTGGYGFSYFALPSTIKVWHDAAHPSVLRIGVLENIQVPSDYPLCGKVLQQPCRADPLAKIH